MKLFRRKSFIVFCIILILLFLNYFQATSPLNSAVKTILSPMQSFLYFAGVKINAFANTQNSPTPHEIKKLQDENKMLLRENITLKTRLEQALKLQEQSQYLTAQRFSYINAKIIAKDIYQQLNFLTLDKGKKDGVMEGFPVVVDEGILIGKIISAEDSSSQIMLLAHSHSQTAGMFVKNNNIMGVVVGDYGLGMKMELVPQEEKIEPGDKVITSGIEKLIPKGLLLGEVNRVEKETQGFFQTLYLKPPVLLNNVFFVSVIRANEL